MDEFKNEESLRSTILDDKVSISDIKQTTNKNKKIFIIIPICIAVVIAGIILYIFLSKEDENNDKSDIIPDTSDIIPDTSDEGSDEPIIINEQEFSVTIEVFKFRKNKGEKEHELPNINIPVYFLGEEFKCNEDNFITILDGKEVKFSKNFTFSKEGNYTVVYKFNKSLESLQNMFRNCYYITKINMSKIDGANLIDISKMFYHCDGLQELYLDGLDIHNVTNAGYMFFMCSSLSNLDLSKLNFSNVKDMISMFM